MLTASDQVSVLEEDCHVPGGLKDREKEKIVVAASSKEVGTYGGSIK